MQQLTDARDRRGRWRRGVSGNPSGRPCGSRNRIRRVRADRERAADWTRHDWQAYYARTAAEAQGDAGMKHAAAFAECVGLWLLLNPPSQRPGMCAQCGRTLDPPNATADGAPIRLDGAWVHWACARWFLRARWDKAKQELERLGIATTG
jgi:Family of unknown function (DUF5681)